jgi:hypothetical protein
MNVKSAIDLILLLAHEADIHSIIQPKRLPKLLSLLLSFQLILDKSPHILRHLFPLLCQCTTPLPLLLHLLSLLLRHLLCFACFQAFQARQDLDLFALEDANIADQISGAKFRVERREAVTQDLGGGGELDSLIA